MSGCGTIMIAAEDKSLTKPPQNNDYSYYTSGQGTIVLAQCFQFIAFLFNKNERNYESEES